MAIKKRVILFCSVLFLVAAAGCSKKITKIEPPSPQQPQKATEQPRFTPTDHDTFQPLDMDAGAKEVLIPIYFEFDKYYLLSSEIPKLQRVASWLSKNKNIRVLCEGHCDERGSSDYNMGLGENRAVSVKKWLTTYGISEYQIETTSYGKERLALPNCFDESCHAQNRRVEWKVIAK
jgi:peptidoglycan-associated lipoprotein